MRPSDLETFTYDCSCGKNCSPWEWVGGKARFNKCFDDGSAQAVARLMPTKSPTEPPAPPVAAKPEPSVKAFANGDVVALVKAGLDDGIVIAKIEQDPGTGLDVSTEALVKLKKQGVSSKVIQAIVKRAGNARQTQASVETAEVTAGAIGKSHVEQRTSIRHAD